MTGEHAISTASANHQLIYKARQLVLLGILLQALHILFGVTAIIGVLITQTRIESTRSTVYHSQLRWQFVTFWVALSGYAIGLYLWLHANVLWGLITTFLIVLYRILVSAVHWRQASAIQRII